MPKHDVFTSFVHLLCFYFTYKLFSLILNLPRNFCHQFMTVHYLYIYCSRKLCTAIFVLHNIKVLISADDEMITNIKQRPNSYNFLVLVIEMISSTMNFRA